MDGIVSSLVVTSLIYNDINLLSFPARKLHKSIPSQYKGCCK